MVMPLMPMSNFPACTPGITDSKSICSSFISMPSFSVMAWRMSTSMPTTSLPSRDSKGGKSGLVATVTTVLPSAEPEAVLVSALELPLPQAARARTMVRARAAAKNFFIFIIVVFSFMDGLARRRRFSYFSSGSDRRYAIWERTEALPVPPSLVRRSTQVWRSMAS